MKPGLSSLKNTLTGLLSADVLKSSMRQLLAVVSIILMLSVPQLVHADDEQGVIRRVVVFPIKTDQAYGDSLDEAWFRMREVLVGNQRFLVASKQFMVQKDVFQPRGTLSPADAIILGKLLDGHAIITTFIEGRDVHMSVYDGEDGATIWENHESMHPSRPVQDQIAPTCQKLMRDFIASVPYQGFVVRDTLEKGLVFRKDDRQMVKVDVGVAAKIAVGDPVQFVHLNRTSLKPLFLGGGQVSVFAEGVVSAIDKNILSVEVTRVSKREKLQEYDLVALPKENQRLRDEAGLFAKESASLNPYLVSKDMQVIENESKKQPAKPYLTAVGFLTSITAFLLLAL